MKMQYRITFALCIMVFFAAVITIGTAELNNTSDANITEESVTNETEVPMEETDSAEPVETTVEPMVTTVGSEDMAEAEDTTVMSDETTVESNEPVDDDAEEDPEESSESEESPGFGALAAIMVVLSAVYLGKIRR